MVGILTFHQVYNYGALLQAYGLQKFLQENGHDALVVNIKTFHRDRPGLLANVKLRKRLLPKTYRYLRQVREKADKFDDFRAHLLKLSDPYEDVAEFLKNNRSCDTLIVGSDQIWNPKYGAKALDTYFLKNAPTSLKKVSYAASSGTGSAGAEAFQSYADALHAFDYISVRDRFTKDFVTDLVRREADIVVDPSLLIDWVDETADLGRFDLPQRYIFSYGITKRTEKVLPKVRDALGMPVVTVGMENEVESRRSDRVFNDVGPLEWIALIRNSAFVITKSFHGLMFALKFRKPVMVVSHGMPAVSRMEDICRRLGITKCIVEDASDIEASGDLLKIIDYKGVEGMQEAEIETSRALLLEHLKA